MPPWWAILLLVLNAVVLFYLIAFNAWAGRINKGLLLMYDTLLKRLDRD